MQKNHSFIIADHIRSASFVIAGGVQPSGKQRGYVLRRLIRRALSSSIALGIDIANRQYFADLVDSVIAIYDGVYEEIKEYREHIIEMLVVESTKYQKAITTGEKEWKKIFASVTVWTSFELAGKTWDLYQTHGVPIEVSEDILEKNGQELDLNELNRLIESHQKLSQDSSAGQFKSGLAENNEKTTRLHTTTHILHQVLRDTFGLSIKQMGSAITSEKARFDISFDRAFTPEEVATIEYQVQHVINSALEMKKIETTEAHARELGAIGLFGEKYGDTVTVYSLTDSNGEVFSREFCGGPHVNNSKEIGTFKILKQKSIGQGLRRLEFDVA